jgi:hyperosmotically inducible periplasmic protein
MTKAKRYASFGISALIFVAAGASAQSTTPPDNTGINKQNASSPTGNADRQKEDPSDRALTKRIRQSVISDKNLSTYAHNVKIVAVNGTVTLNGVVRSDQEREDVGMKAAEVAGKDHVVNDLKVAPAQ